MPPENTPAPNPPPNPAPPAPAPDYAKEIADLRASNEALSKKIEGLTAKPDPKNELDLQQKAKADREEKEKKATETRALENALKFNLGSADFLKTNGELLPKDAAEIFKLAEKENYSSAVEKDSAIKSGLINSFFAVQANVDLLTPTLKTQLDEYQALTKNERQSRAQGIYDAIFEPTFEMLKRIKKAEQLNKAKAMGHGVESDDETKYKEKMMSLSKKHYLGEK